jgi:hypothetical protein
MEDLEPLVKIWESLDLEVNHPEYAAPVETSGVLAYTPLFPGKVDMKRIRSAL